MLLLVPPKKYTKKEKKQMNKVLPELTILQFIPMFRLAAEKMQKIERQ